MNEFQVKLSENQQDEGTGKALGISEVRAEVIINHMVSLGKKADHETTVAETLKDASLIAENANELAFMAFCTGVKFQEDRSRNPITAVLSSIFTR